MSAQLLTVDGLSVRRGGRLILQEIGFRVTAGHAVALVGPNGSGKSTLLRAIAGLLRPEAGTIGIEPEPEAERAALIHYLGHLDGLKPGLTVAENLAFWRQVMGGRGDIGPALDAVGLGHLDHLPVSILSAGQKRRVAIARLLTVDRPIWLLDEPATALDAASEETLGRLIAGHLDGGGMVLAATHRPLPVTPAATIDLGGAP